MKVLLTTSGIGSRLGEYTKETNKSLVPLGYKPILSHIIEKYPKEISFVVTLGYFGNYVKQFLETAYPDRTFEFVTVDRYVGAGSSLLYSMSLCEKHLQEPFIFNACDSILDFDFYKQIENKDGNVCIVAKSGSANYCTIRTKEDSVVEFFDKGNSDYDFSYVGVAKINDWKEFWSCSKDFDFSDSSLNDVSVFEKMLSENCRFSFLETEHWLDVGNIDSFLKIRNDRFLSTKTLPKVGEQLFFVNNKVIKFFSNTKEIEKKKQKILRNVESGRSDLFPNNFSATNNFYSHDFIEGKTLSEVCYPEDLNDLLNFTYRNFWNSEILVDETVYGKTKEFYIDKTTKRVEMLLKDSEFVDYFKHVKEINGTKFNFDETLYMLNTEDFYEDLLSDVEFVPIHGDFILENIIKTEDGFKFIDWRGDFSGDTLYGDIYYDLAKLWHNLIFNHDIVFKNGYELSKTDENIKFDIVRRQRLIDCEKTLRNWITTMGLNLNKVIKLRNIIWLNMAPLHGTEFSKVLFCLFNSKI